VLGGNVLRLLRDARVGKSAAQVKALAASGEQSKVIRAMSDTSIPSTAFCQSLPESEYRL
jgi:hypothetical protein